MTVTGGPTTCINGERLEVIVGQARPWAPGRREYDMQIQQAADNPDRQWCMSEVDIFRVLDEQVRESMAQGAPMRTYPAGTLVFSPHRATGDPEAWQFSFQSDCLTLSGDDKEHAESDARTPVDGLE